MRRRIFGFDDGVRDARSTLPASLAFFLVGPGLEAGVGPFVLTGWERGDGALDTPLVILAGAVLVLAGLAVVVHAYARFALDGRGTPAPVAPPTRLVARGAYRHVRHPMYVATAAVIAGEGLVLARPILLVAAAVYLTAMAVLAVALEEPVLRRRHGAAYDAYAAEVPRWLPRLGLRR